MAEECMHKQTTQSVLRRNGVTGELSVCAGCGFEVDFRPFRPEDMPTGPVVEERAEDMVATTAPELRAASERLKQQAPASIAVPPLPSPPATKRHNPLEAVRDAKRVLEAARNELEIAVRDLPVNAMVRTDRLKELYEALQAARKQLRATERY